jgi:CheY-like chemotaxis protein
LAVEEDTPMRQIRLLVVEDHAATVGGMKTYLELMGYAVEVAGSVASARERARAVAFDVLVCDLNLPDGTGWELLNSLTEKMPVRAVAFSAYDEPEYRENSRAAGFLDYIVKGSAPELLVEAIERAVGAEIDPVEASGAEPPKAQPSTRRCR